MAMREQLARVERMIASGDYTDGRGVTLLTPERAVQERDRLKAQINDAVGLPS